MLEQIEGSKAIARAVAGCQPEVVCAYPITPQTHIVEALGGMVKSGRLPGCQFINADSEFAALSVTIGASATGSRAYTATASQGLLYMTEAVYNAAGLGLPIVMTVANRAIGAPINIWNDHSDSMALRDSGWVQMYAIDNQHAVDLHPLAFRLAEALSIPVMVCVDGFALTHATEAVDVPDQEQIDSFLPPYDPRQKLDPATPLTIGAMVGPEAFTEVKFLADMNFRRVLDVLPELTADLAHTFGRLHEPLIRPYGHPKADTVVVAQGSVVGTLETVVDGIGRAGTYRLLAVNLFRPFPADAVQAALEGARRVVVLERAVAPGGPGFLTTEILSLVSPAVRVETLIAGLGGRPITVDALEAELTRTDGPPRRFLDLDSRPIVELVKEPT